MDLILVSAVLVVVGVVGLLVWLGRTRSRVMDVHGDQIRREDYTPPPHSHGTGGGG